MKRVYFEKKTDCPSRQLDIQRLKDYFLLNKWIMTSSAEEADIIILAGCGGTAITAYEGINKMIKIQNRLKPGQKLILTGCLPTTAKDLVKRLFRGTKVPVYQYGKIDSIIEAEVKFTEIPEPNIIQQKESFPEIEINKYLMPESKKYTKCHGFDNPDNIIGNFRESIYRDFIKNRISCYFIKVQKGCIYNCSYCMCRYAIGYLKSKPLSAIRKELLIAIEKGYKNIFITGESIACYGRDIHLDLKALLEVLARQKGNYRLFLHNICPSYFTKIINNITHLFAKGHIIGMHFPIQSGSNRILKSMRRSYSYDSVKSAISSIRDSAGRLFISTDVIVGFPGETESDFLKTISLLNEAEFDYVSLRPYNDRPGSISSRMTNKVPFAIIEKRIKKALREIKKGVRINFQPILLAVEKKNRDLLEQFYNNRHVI